MVNERFRFPLINKSKWDYEVENGQRFWDRGLHFGRPSGFRLADEEFKDIYILMDRDDESNITSTDQVTDRGSSGSTSSRGDSGSTS